MDFLRIPREIATVEPSIVFKIFGYPVANSTLMLLVVVVLTGLVAVYVTRRASLSPARMQNVIEVLYERIYGIVAQIVGDERRATLVFPAVAALFVFILVSNILGLVPGLGEIQFAGTQVFRTATSDFNTTFALALGAVLVLQWVSVREWGILAHLGKYFQFAEVYRGFKKGIGAGINALVGFAIGLLDIVGEVAKVVSLSLRLFGNMFAGQVLATIILGGVALAIPALWMSMSLLSAIVQTMVFAFLVTAYYTLAIKPEDAASPPKDG